MCAHLKDAFRCLQYLCFLGLIFFSCFCVTYAKSNRIFWFRLWLASHLKRKEIQRYYFTNTKIQLHTSDLQPFAGALGDCKFCHLFSEARTAPLAVVPL